MVCPALHSDVRALAGEHASGLASPQSRVGVWMAAFSTMAVLLSALLMGEAKAGQLTEWLQNALLLGTTFLGAHRNGDSLLLHDLCSRPLAPLSLQDRLQELQQLLESLRSPAVYLIVQASDEHGLLRQAALSAFEHLTVMGFSYIARLFTAFLAAVERDIIDVQMQSATHNDLAGLVFDGGCLPLQWGPTLGSGTVRSDLFPFASTVFRCAVWGGPFFHLRHYESQTTITASLSKVFELVRAILAFHPRRIVNLHSNHLRRVVVASDASQDAPRQGKARLLLSAHDFARLGAVIHIDSSVFRLWDDSDTKIAQLELLAVVQGLIAFSNILRNAHIVWFVDNVAALMALIKGRSDHDELDHMAQIAHSLLFHLHCFAFFEWVPSSSNWSDGVSRNGFRDPWLNRHGFSVHLSSIPVCLWTLPFPLIIWPR